MRHIIPTLLSLIFITTACANPAVPASAPKEQIGMTSTPQVVPLENTAIATLPPEPTATATSVPPSHWYWGVASDTEMVIAVNQFGETRELGTLEQTDDLHTSFLSIDDERAFLFLDLNNNLRVYLLTPDTIQKIALPSDPFYFDSDHAQNSRAVVARHDDRVVFSYVTGGGSNVMPNTGPLLLMDLTSLTATLIDETVSRGPYRDNSRWLHSSEDGRYLRYLNGDSQNMEFRELDLVTGDARTFYTTTGSSFGIHASPQGDQWYLRNAKLILTLDGEQKDFANDSSQTVRLLKDGMAMTYPLDCVDDCEIRISTPFRDDPELTYHFPWAIQYGASYAQVNQYLPDRSLIFAGEPYLGFANPPAALETYPDLTEEDSPLFRLTPDGQARLVGILANNISDDRRYILLESSDHTSFFIYDVMADRPLFDMPMDSTLEDYYPTVRFFDRGILVTLGATVPSEENAYRVFDHV